VTWIAAALPQADSAGFATSPTQEVKLIPQPKELRPKTVKFTVTQKTRIFLGEENAEDRFAARLLAEDLEKATGFPCSISVTKTIPPRGPFILLARVGRLPVLQQMLREKGLAIDETFDAEGYVLDVEADRIIVSAPTGAGIFYGIQTLRQLLTSEKKGTATFLGVSIKDWPAMRYRGLHDDISRGPVPTMDYIKKQIRLAAEYKLNLFSFYIEHVFDYQKHPLIGPKEGSLTADEVRELVEYAKRYHVELLPEQQAFGHLHHVLKYERYADVAETPHGHVLAPVNEKSYDLIKDLYAELVPLFPGKLFHIGSDETFELGQGQTKQLAEGVGLGQVYMNHLKRVYEILKPYNKQLMFWGDIALHYPQLLGLLPKDMIVVSWTYSAHSEFDRYLKPFKEAGLPIFVAPGVSNWNRIFPNYDVALVNIRNFVRDGQRYGAMGMLNTTWDDDGEALFGMTWYGVVFGAAAAWQSGESSIDQFRSAFDWAFYRNSDESFATAIEELTRIHGLLRNAGLGEAHNELFWADPFSESDARMLQRAVPVAREIRLRAEEALEILYKNRAKAKLNEETLDYLILAAMRLDCLGMKIQFASEIGKLYWEAFLNQNDRQRVLRPLNEILGWNGRLLDLRDYTTRVREHYRDLWLKENRPYWLGNVLIKYDAQLALWQKKFDQFEAARAQFLEKGFLPTPEQMGIYFK